MDDPDRGDGHCEPECMAAEAVVEWRGEEGAAEDGEQNAAGRDVDEEIDSVVAPDAQRGGGVVEGEREAYSRPAGDGSFVRGGQGCARRPKMAHVRVGL